MAFRMLLGSTSRVASHLKTSHFRRPFSSIPAYLSERKYTKSHEWVNIDGNKATVGVTEYVQESIHDVVYVELPEVGSLVRQGQIFGTAEGTKATKEVKSPISGKVFDFNKDLTERPELVNEDPYLEGWMIKVEMSDEDEVKNLMEPEAYFKLCDEEKQKQQEEEEEEDKN